MTTLGAASIVAGVLFHLSLTEWAILTLTIGLVLCAELMNTLVEYLCDLFRPKYDQRIKVLKDLASAAPLFASIVSLTIAALLFVPKILR
jgi:diacylglycerol kinase